MDNKYPIARIMSNSEAKNRVDVAQYTNGDVILWL